MTKRFTSAVFFFLLVSIPASADFIGVGFFNGGRVARINESTGASQIIGFTSPEVGLTASLTRDPLTDTFYTVGGLQSGGIARLFTLDPNTGQTTLIAALSQNLYIQALAASPNGGLLYGTRDLDNTLYTIDPHTGQVAMIGSMGLGFSTVYALAFAPDGTLYGYTNIDGELGNSGPGFFRVDPTTATTTVLTPTGVGPLPQIQDMAFAPDGLLWASSGSAIQTINLQTGLSAGQAHLVSFDIRGMAFLPAATVPEPASLFLLGAGLAALALTRLRK